MLTCYFQIQECDLKEKRSPITEQLSPPTSFGPDDFALPGEWLVSRLVYDVATGLVEIVVPPAPIRTA